MTSFRKKGPGAIASGLIGAAVGFAIVGGAIAVLSYPAFAGKGDSFVTEVTARP